jgi:hypothetical protein
MAYKIKETTFNLMILSLEEVQEVIEGVDKKINELGRSVTSKLRTPYSVDCTKASKVLSMDDGNELTVSLKVTLTQSVVGGCMVLLYWLGQTIRFYRNGCRKKKAGCPRHAHYKREYQG